MTVKSGKVRKASQQHRMGCIPKVMPAGIQFPRNEGIALRINEAYEHEPILPYQSEENCPQTGCNKTATQCVDVAAVATLAPAAVFGTPTFTCQGSPSTVCVTNEEGTLCTVTFTQRVCMSIPIRYSVTMTPGESSIACANSDAAGTGGSCSCCC